MEESIIRLSVPAQATYARSVRMMAANLAVLCTMSVDEVEDARMAAEEAFVYACATQPATCDMEFCVTDDGLHMTLALGDSDPAMDSVLAEHIELAQLLLEAVSDVCEFTEDGSHLHIAKLVGGRS